MIDLRSNPAVGLRIVADRRSDLERQAAEHRLGRDLQAAPTRFWSMLPRLRIRLARPTVEAPGAAPIVLYPSPG
jgi:hypothetical protein